MDELTPNEHLAPPESFTTPNVQKALDTVNVTEAHISEQLGRELSDPELPTLTDDALVHVAERSTDYVKEHPEKSETAEEAVEVALIEGALEVTGERPPGAVSPILKLEIDGYDQQVTEGVRKLHEEGATLPDGEPAAEVIAQAIPPQGESAQQRHEISDELDTAIQYYTHGASKEDLQQAGIDPSIVTKHIRSISEDERDFLKEQRRKSLDSSTTGPQEVSVQETPLFSNSDLETAFVYGVQEDSGMTQTEIDTWYDSLPEDQRTYYAQAKQELRDQAEQQKQLETIIEHNLEASAPELLEGKLPHNLAERLGTEYILAIRQLGEYEADEAQEQLVTDGGVNVANLGLTQSFDLLSQAEDSLTTSRGLVINGYYGARAGGKFVIVVPLERAADNPTAAYDSIPDMQQDLQSGSDPDHRVVNPKYVAGFIDGQGVFHPNENFMRSSEANIGGEVKDDNSVQAEATKPVESTNHYERLTDEQLNAVRDNIADSVVQGIRKYDLTEVARASANLAAIQREFETRFVELRPTHQRGEVHGTITYSTEPDATVVQKIVSELQKIDGASNIARAMYGGLEIPRANESDQESRLRAIEMQSLLSNISKEVRRINGSDLSENTNPYAAMTNEKLTLTVERLKETIRSRAAQGLDTKDFRKRLALVGQVIQGRR